MLLEGMLGSVGRTDRSSSVSVDGRDVRVAAGAPKRRTSILAPPILRGGSRRATLAPSMVRRNTVKHNPEMAIQVLKAMGADDDARVMRRTLQRRIRTGVTKISCEMQDTVIAVDISPDGQYFVAAGNSREAVVYNAMNGEEVCRIKVTMAITSVKFTHGPRTSDAESDDGVPRRLGPLSASREPGGTQEQPGEAGAWTAIPQRVWTGIVPHRQPSGGNSASIAHGGKASSRGAAGAIGAGGEQARSLKLLIGTYAAGEKPNVLLVDVMSQVRLSDALFGRDEQRWNVQTSAVTTNGSLYAVGGDSQHVLLYRIKLAPSARARAAELQAGGGEPLHEGALQMAPAGEVRYPSHVTAVSMNAAGTLLGIAGDAQRVQLWTLVDQGASGAVHARMGYQFNCHTAIYGLDISANGFSVAAGTNKRTEVWRVRYELPSEVDTNLKAAAHAAGQPAVRSAGGGGERFSAAQLRARLRWKGARRTFSDQSQSDLQLPGSVVSLGMAARSTGGELDLNSLSIERIAGRRFNSSASLGGGQEADAADLKRSAAEELTRRLSNTASRATQDADGSAAAGGGELGLGEAGQLMHEQLSVLLGNGRSSSARRRAAAQHPAIHCEPVQVFEQPAPQGGVSFSRDASRLAIAGDQLVTLHDVQSGSTLRSFKQGGRVRCVAVSALGTEVVSGGFDKRASLVAADAGAELLEARGVIDVVRSVHVLGELFAIGGSTRQGGLAQLFTTADGFKTPLCEWRRAKEVRCVHLTRGKALLAIAGHDCIVQLVCTVTFATLCELNYTGRGGVPHFVWSVDISTDVRVMAVGCWSSKVHVYLLGNVPEAPTPEPVRSSLVSSLLGQRAAGAGSAVTTVLRQRVVRPTEVAVLSRGDRVYSVSLDGEGSKLLVGGRDKTAAMYDLSETIGKSRREPRLLWEERVDEFIYTVSMSRDWSVCAFGGMGKSVKVMTAHSHQLLFEVPVAGTVHAVSVQEDGQHIALSGELPHITVYDRRGVEKLCIPMGDDAFCVSLTAACLAYTSHRHAVLFGRSGHAFGWQDQPSWTMATKIIRSSTEENLLRFLSRVLDANPSLVNSRSSADGGSFLKFIVEISRDADILDLVLNASTSIGLLPDGQLTTALHMAVENGNRTAMRRILRGFLSGRLARMPGSMRQVFSCFELIAKRYPHDFVDFISAVELEPEPEVLDLQDSTDVVLPAMVVKGSPYRYPKGIWQKVIDRYKISDESAGRQVRDEEPEEDGDDEDEPQRNGAPPRPPPRKKPPGAPIGQGGTDGDRGGGANGGASAHGITGGAGAGGGAGAPRAAEPPPQTARAAPLKIRRSTALLRSLGSRAFEPPIDEGLALTKSASSGLTALRVPFQNFAGFGPFRKGQVGSSPLQLVSLAARTTGDYSVFGATLVEATLEYKWETFARRQFWFELGLYLVKMAFVYAHVLVVLFPFSTNGTAETVIGLGLAELRQHELWAWSVSTWLATTYFALMDEWNELRQLLTANTLADYLGLWNFFDQLFIVLQLTANALLLHAALTPGAEYMLGGFAPLMRIDGAGGRLGRVLRAGGGGGSSAELLPSDLEPVFQDEDGLVRLITMCEAIVFLCVHLKLLYYARGFTKLGVLVRMIMQILIDMLSFMFVLFVILAGFGFALYVLRRHRYTELSDIVVAVMSVVDSGLYADLAPETYQDAGVVQLAVFTTFMIITQIVLLNLLIAIMSDSYAKVRTQAELASKYEKAQVVLEMEVSPPLLERVVSTLFGLTDGDKFPRWLHVLMPEADEVSQSAISAGSTSNGAERATAPRGGWRAGVGLEQRLDALENKLDTVIDVLSASEATKRSGGIFQRAMG